MDVVGEKKADMRYRGEKEFELQPLRIDELLTSGRYWEAMDVWKQTKSFAEKNENINKPQILYDIDWDRFFEGMCCYAGADSCLSGVGGCGGCGGCLCGAYCLCFCCTGEHPAEGCDCMMNCWNSCCCIEILCGPDCKC